MGSTREIRTDVRFLAATNKDLAQEVAASRFRDDLYYRLNVITIATPPLRERIEDIPLLVRHFLTLDPCGPRHIEPEALELLVHHRWPGNIRELANVIERAKILAEGPSITVDDLPEELCLLPLSELPVPGRPPGVVKRDEPGGPGVASTSARRWRRPGGTRSGRPEPWASAAAGCTASWKSKGSTAPRRPEHPPPARVQPRSSRLSVVSGVGRDRARLSPADAVRNRPSRNRGMQPWGWLTSAVAETTYTGPSAGRAM